MFFSKKKLKPPSSVPRHIAVILDGNGRWATMRGLPRTAGHAAGIVALRRIASYCADIGVRYLTVYAFSTENFKRPKEEVDTIMSLLLDYLKNFEREIEGRNVRIRAIGDRSVLSESIRLALDHAEEATRRNTDLNLIVALNYGGRAELVRAAELIAKGGADTPITEGVLCDALYTTGIPDPDLLIRPGGEKRLSNFLLWQAAYSELYFCDTLWPDFKERHLNEAIRDFNQRNRRYGGLANSPSTRTAENNLKRGSSVPYKG